MNNMKQQITHQQASIIENSSVTDKISNCSYIKPQTSQFLNPTVIQGGETNVPESNSGLLS